MKNGPSVWAPAFALEIQKKLHVPGFLWPHSAYGRNLGSEPADARPLYLSLPLSLSHSSPFSLFPTSISYFFLSPSITAFHIKKRFSKKLKHKPVFLI